LPEKLPALERAQTLLTSKIANYRKIEERTGVPNPVLAPEAASSMAVAS
jgi:hypothetical protein